ncbi:MAG: hypothetical protein AAGA81_14105 [Acidobacteriota bacterium]
MRLWNLTRSRQAEIEQAPTAQVIVDAGYRNDRGAETIYRGELFRARSRRAEPNITTELSGVDAITVVEARDGGRGFRQARIEQSFGAGVSVNTVLRACAAALGVGIGNLDQVTGVELEAGGNIYPEGVVLSGPVSRELTRVLRGLGLRWSVQHGALQLLRGGELLQTEAIRLTPSTSLIGTPEVGARGVVRVVSLLTPDLWPGRAIVLESRRVNGRYRARKVTYTGDSHGGEWQCISELEPVGAAA